MSTSQHGLILKIGVGVREWGITMLDKKNITSMSDLSDYLPKSLCRVSETNESIESDFSLINPQLKNDSKSVG